jgi:hypothetical protein
MSASALPTAPPSPAPRRSFFVFRFSLRLLLLAVTAFAIGFPIWYRWPYAEEEPVYPMTNIGTRSAVNLVPDERHGPSQRIVTTWQRKWGGGRARQGAKTTFDRSGTVLSVEHYVDDVLEGPTSRFSYLDLADPFALAVTGERHDTETRAVHGQHRAGKQSGMWTRSVEVVKYEKTGLTTFAKRQSTPVLISESWREGKLHGQATVKDGDAIAFAAEFDDGRLVKLNGEEVQERLHQFLPREKIDLERVAAALDQPSGVGTFSGPVMDLTSFFSDFSYPDGPPVQCESMSVARHKVQAGLAGIDLRTALFLATEPFGLSCDYRYGSIWLTSAADAQNWHDTTGVGAIQPPADSALAAVWNQTADVTTEWRPPGSQQTSYVQPLAETMTGLALRLNVKIDNTQIEPTPDHPDGYPITAVLNGLPFRHVLGHLLSRTHCRCKLEGETLVILPPEKETGRH